MEIKCFYEDFPKELETKINNFIKGKNVVDIKYQISAGCKGAVLTALVMYEDTKPCKYCDFVEQEYDVGEDFGDDNKTDFTLESDDRGYYIAANTLGNEHELYSKNIKYCPICGRRLSK